MISSYDPNFHGVHTIRVTFMQWDYTGHVSFEIGGNCKGAELMDFTFLECDNQEEPRERHEHCRRRGSEQR